MRIHVHSKPEVGAPFLVAIGDGEHVGRETVDSGRGTMLELAVVPDPNVMCKGETALRFRGTSKQEP